MNLKRPPSNELVAQLVRKQKHPSSQTTSILVAEGNSNSFLDSHQYAAIKSYFRLCQHYIVAAAIKDVLAVVVAAVSVNPRKTLPAKLFGTKPVFSQCFLFFFVTWRYSLFGFHSFICDAVSLSSVIVLAWLCVHRIQSFCECSVLHIVVVVVRMRKCSLGIGVCSLVPYLHCTQSLLVTIAMVEMMAQMLLMTMEAVMVTAVGTMALSFVQLPSKHCMTYFLLVLTVDYQY